MDINAINKVLRRAGKRTLAETLGVTNAAIKGLAAQIKWRKATTKRPQQWAYVLRDPAR